jgi:hypothetical protein
MKSYHLVQPVNIKNKHSDQTTNLQTFITKNLLRSQTKKSQKLSKPLYPKPLYLESYMSYSDDVLYIFLSPSIFEKDITNGQTVAPAESCGPVS